MIDLDELIAALRERAASDSPAHTLMNEAAMIRDDLSGGEYASAPDELPYAATSRRIARALCEAYTEGKLT